MVTTTPTMVAKTHAYVIYQCESSVLHTLQYLLSDSMIGRTTMQLMCLGGPAEKYNERYFCSPCHCKAVKLNGLQMLQMWSCSSSVYAR